MCFLILYLQSDDNFFTINNLAPNTTYNISALAVHSSNRYSVIALEQQFQTLRRAYTPGNVTDIKVSDFLEDKDNRMHLSAVLTWKPPPGNVQTNRHAHPHLSTATEYIHMLVYPCLPRCTLMWVEKKC